MAHQVLSDLDFNSVTKITNLPNGVSAGDAVNMSQLDAAVQGVAWKDSVRTASTANVTLATPGTTMDGITLTSGDRVLLKNQTAGAENGIYIWTSSATLLTRSVDADTAIELEAAICAVEEGTANGGVAYRQTAANFTLGVGTVTWTVFGASAGAASETSSGIAEIATQGEVDALTDDLRFITPLKLANWSGRIRKYSLDIGDASATTIAVTHSFNTYDVMATVHRNSGNRDNVLVETRRTSVNALSLVFATAPASAAFRCVVIG